MSKVNPNNRKREKPGRFGTDIASYQAALTNWTATTTVTQVIASPWPPSAGDAYYIESLALGMHTAGADSDGVMTLKFQKVRGGSGGTIIDLTDTISVEAATIAATPKTFNVPLLSTLTPTQTAFIQGDILIASKVNDSAAIDTQPVGVAMAEFAVGG